eukprot:276296-Rhodomonas_salina.2
MSSTSPSLLPAYAASVPDIPQRARRRIAVPHPGSVPGAGIGDRRRIAEVTCSRRIRTQPLQTPPRSPPPPPPPPLSPERGGEGGRGAEHTRG